MKIFRRDVLASRTTPAMALGLRTVYKHENEDKLQAYRRYNPAACNETLNGRVGNPPGR